jgi:two-component system response regulator HydG
MIETSAGANMSPAIPGARILVAVTNQEADLLSPAMATWGYEATRAVSISEATGLLMAESFDAVIVGFDAASEERLTLIDAATRLDETLPVLFITDDGGEVGTEALRRGAFQYIHRPVAAEDVRVLLDGALQSRVLETAHHELVREVRDRFEFESLVGHSAPMRMIFDLVQRVADSPASVLITGESGTGKELIARAIHFRGRRAHQPFVPVNCAAIPASLLESELFGYEKGAFTGANRARAGLFVQAAGGTLFLDEIGDMPLDLQPKILRALQEGEIRPVGSDRVRRIAVRVIAATNADLQERIRNREFRQDLFYRLNVVPIEIPALRERPDDIPLLVDRFLDKAQERNPDIAARKVAPEALELLMLHDWPGNVRELENVVERAATLCSDEVIGVADLRFLEGRIEADVLEELFHGEPSLREVEERYIEYVLKRVGGNRVRACAILEIDPSTLYRRSRRKTTR